MTTMKRSVLTLVFVLSTAVAASAQTTFYFPQVANGFFGNQFFKTTILLTNPAAVGSAAVSGSITFTQSDGTALNMPFVDTAGAPVGSGNTIPFQLAGGQSRKFTSTGSGAGTQGFAVVSASGNVGGTAYYSLFGAAGNLISEAGVPAAIATARQAVFVDSVGGFRTGLAYANPSVSASASLTLRLLNADGVSVVSTATSLGASRHVAAYVNTLIDVPAEFVGTMQIDSNAPLTAIALRFSPADEFTTIPPVTLASLMNPYIEWLEDRQWLAPFTSLARLVGSFQFRLG